MRAVVWVALLTLASIVARAESADPDPLRESFLRGDTAERINRKLAEYASLGFAGVVLVEKDGVIILHKSYRPPDRSGDSAGVDVAYPLGSMTRMFAAAAVLRLECEGRIATHDRLSRWLDDPPEEMSDWTIQDLLVGTISPSDLIPRIVEKAAGESFEDTMRDRLFQAAGMSRTSYAPGGSAPPAGRDRPGGHLRRVSRLPFSATWIRWLGGRIRTQEERSRRVVFTPAAPSRRGSDGLLSTAGDLFEWELAMRSERVLSEEEKQKLYNPISNDRSYGWKMERTGQGRTRFAFRGERPGYESLYCRYPDDAMTLIVLASTRLGWLEPVRDAIESQVYSSRSVVVIALAIVVLLYIILRGAMGRRLREVNASRVRRGRIFRSRKS